MDTNNQVTLVKRYFQAIRDGNLDGIVATFAANAQSLDPVSAPAHIGHAAIRKFFQGTFSLFKKVELNEDSIFSAGNSVAVKWTGHGVGQSGREVRFEGIDVFEINPQGLIQELRAYWDPAVMVQELKQ